MYTLHSLLPYSQGRKQASISYRPALQANVAQSILPARLSAFLLCIFQFICEPCFCTVYGRCAVYSVYLQRRRSATLDLIELNHRADQAIHFNTSKYSTHRQTKAIGSTTTGMVRDFAICFKEYQPPFLEYSDLRTGIIQYRDFFTDVFRQIIL